jgi:hypothetical protein
VLATHVHLMHPSRAAQRMRTGAAVQSARRCLPDDDIEL